MDQYRNEDDGGIQGAFESSPFTGGSLYGSLNGIKSGLNVGLEIAVWVVLIIVLIVLMSGSTIPTWGWVVITIILGCYVAREAFQFFSGSSSLSATSSP